MAKDKSPAFQFYPDSWLSSTDIALMTPAEEGAYIRLLCHAWMQPDCGLPDDDEALAVLSRLGKKWEHCSGRKIRRKFYSADGRLFNKRLLEERSKQEEWSQKSSDGGRKGAEIRWGRNKQTVTTPITTPIGYPSNGYTTPIGGTITKPITKPITKNSSSSSSSSSSSETIPPTPSESEEKPPDRDILRARYSDLMDQWPEDCRGVELGYAVWSGYIDQGIITGENLDEVFEGLKRWKASELWTKEDGKYIPALANTDIQRPGWLQRKAWMDHPKPAAKAINKADPYRLAEPAREGNR